MESETSFDFPIAPFRSKSCFAKPYVIRNIFLVEYRAFRFVDVCIVPCNSDEAKIDVACKLCGCVYCDVLVPLY